MTTSLIVNDTHPKKAFDQITQVGLRTLSLGALHKTTLEQRLPGALDNLAQQLDVFGVAIPGVLQNRNEAAASTAAQNDRIQQGFARVRAVRALVRRAGVKRGVRRAYSVGLKVDPTQAKSVTAALKQIVERATTAPEEAAMLGLGPVAVAELTSFLASLQSALTTQDEKRANAPLSTKERNLAGRRVLQTVALIAGAGMLAFADDPVTYANFEALIRPSKRRPSKKTAEAAPPKSPPPSPVAADAVTATPDVTGSVP
jgi:hypothetical protein